MPLHLRESSEVLKQQSDKPSIIIEGMFSVILLFLCITVEKVATSTLESKPLRF